MTGELAFALGDRSSRRLHGGSIVRLCVLQRRQGLLDPVGFQKSVTYGVQRFHADRSYSLSRPPRTGRRLMR